MVFYSNPMSMGILAPFFIPAYFMSSLIQIIDATPQGILQMASLAIGIALLVHLSISLVEKQYQNKARASNQLGNNSVDIPKIPRCFKS
mmetsp:Transcript_7429/g.8560  ORF Transcript_7429/g.8560 Transcript_7429/m.8560 type:complete len:89 (+) Transcript_7429:51-317(+)